MVKSRLWGVLKGQTSKGEMSSVNVVTAKANQRRRFAKGEVMPRQSAAKELPVTGISMTAKAINISLHRAMIYLHLYSDNDARC
jgi:hypothetical protein